MRVSRVLSDQLSPWSACDARQTDRQPTPPPQDLAAPTPAGRTRVAWLPHRTLQTLRQAGVQVCPRSRPWPQTLSVGEPLRRAPGDGLRAAGPSRASGAVSGQLPTDSRHPRRVVRHQPRTAASTRHLLSASDEPLLPSRPSRYSHRQSTHRQHAPDMARCRARRGSSGGGKR